MDRFLRRWQCKKNQESVFPPRQQFALAESNVTTLELWSLLKACNFQEKG